ncbi:MAG TPA: MauE/DoxX family redox-associated membrane protein [Dermatophilaceae bacterium]|nr:MauE/DoxX family redox-associated membrane protein [Dermatophilaceae bacterium]
MGTGLAAPFLAAAALLVVAGAPKVLDPTTVLAALRSVGLPAARGPVRALAGAECAVGVASPVAPGRVTALLLAGTYAVFTAFVAVALRRGGVVASCGCFGKADTPPTASHLLVTALFAAVALGVAAAPPAASWWRVGPAGALALAVAAALVAFLAWQVLAVRPTTTPASVRSVRRG